MFSLSVLRTPVSRPHNLRSAKLFSTTTKIAMSNPGNVARGLKAAVSNPNNSEEAKERAQQRLDDMEASGEANSAEAHDAQVKQGHKANLSNPNTSEEAKQKSKRVLSED